MDEDRSVKTEFRAGNEVETSDFFFFRKRSWEECDLLKEELEGACFQSRLSATESFLGQKSSDGL